MNFLVLFLPFFAQRAEGIIQGVSLMALGDVQPYLKTAYCAAVISMIVMGVLTLAMQRCQMAMWVKSKTTVSLVLGGIVVLLFIVSSQPYAAVFAFTLLTIKAVMLIKRP